MKRIFKRSFAALIAATTMAVTGSYTVLNTSAAGRLTTNADQGQNSFSDKWSAVWTFECGDTYTGSMTIGFDTWWTDEDFVKFFGTKNGNHYAGVKNSSNTIEYTNTEVGGSSTGKADVKHTGTPVTYYAFWGV